MAVVAIVLAGLVLTSGLARGRCLRLVADSWASFSARWPARATQGILLTFRAANRSLAPTPGPLLESTLGVVAGALLVAPFDARFSFVPHFPAHAWLIVLAIVAQVIGWLLIATALPRLPALETSILLLGQPVFALIWGVLVFGERLSPLQWAGAAVVLVGVAAASAAVVWLSAQDARSSVFVPFMAWTAATSAAARRPLSIAPFM